MFTVRNIKSVPKISEKRSEIGRLKDKIFLNLIIAKMHTLAPSKMFPKASAKMLTEGIDAKANEKIAFTAPPKQVIKRT